MELDKRWRTGMRNLGQYLNNPENLVNSERPDDDKLKIGG